METSPHPFDHLEPSPLDEADTVLVPRVHVVRVAVKQAGGYAPVARKVGTSAGYLHDIAHGRRRGSEDVLTRLAEVVKVPLDELAAREPRGTQAVA